MSSDPIAIFGGGTGGQRAALAIRERVLSAFLAGQLGGLVLSSPRGNPPAPA